MRCYTSDRDYSPSRSSHSRECQLVASLGGFVVLPVSAQVGEGEYRGSGPRSGFPLVIKKGRLYAGMSQMGIRGSIRPGFGTGYLSWVADIRGPTIRFTNYDRRNKPVVELIRFSTCGTVPCSSSGTIGSLYLQYMPTPGRKPLTIRSHPPGSRQVNGSP